MTDRVAIRRLPTGVPGLDEILGGGVPEFSFNLIAGAPGTGKTTLAQQIMFALAGTRPPGAVSSPCWASRPSRCCAISSSSAFFDMSR
jgi:circadian clock protein KaiC